MPTYRVTYRPSPGVRHLLEDLDADDLVTRGGTYELVQDQLVILTPREIVVLRVAAVDVTAIRRVCELPARWGGVRLPVDDASRRPGSASG